MAAGTIKNPEGPEERKCGKLKNILCFGDSNTFGFHHMTGGRLGPEERWTGLLQSLLGPEYHVIEEGCNGRTTAFDDPIEDDRNGVKALPMLLESHRPLDLVVLSLGTNDCKSRFHVTEVDIARGMDRLVRMVKNYDYKGMAAPQVLVLCPVRLREGIGEREFTSFTEEGRQVCARLPAVYRRIAGENGCAFFDAGAVAEPSENDYVHIPAAGHRRLAEALAPLVRELLEP